MVCLSYATGVRRSKMKKKLYIAFMTSLAIFTAASATTAAFAWFYRETGIPDYNISGGTDGAYFAYGTGTADDPFGIRTPKHLSNLAWLQYNGYFDTNLVDDQYGLDTYYFELGKDIDCSGWVIPPIGTIDHPFIGNFNGAGYTISNLTVSNQRPINTKPRIIEYNDQPEIVGLFGVVGSYPIDENTISPSATYDTSTNRIANVGIDGITVKSVTPKTLVGLAAGYVNGELKNVAIDSFKSQNKTTLSQFDIQYEDVQPITGMNYLSEYSLVGHCEEAYQSKIQQVDEQMFAVSTSQKTFTAKEQSTDGNPGWGGSIDMKGTYNRLDKVWKHFNSGYTRSPNYIGDVNAVSYYRNKAITIDENGVTQEPTYSNPIANSLGNSNPIDKNITNNGSYKHSYYTYNHKDTSEADANKQQTSSYSFVIQTTGVNNYADEEMYMCLTGGKTVEVTNQLSVTTTDNSVVANYIYTTINGTKYYLTNNGTSGVTATTSQNNSAVWIYSGNKLFTYINNTQYYLRYSSSALSLNTTNSTNWTWDSTNNCYYYDNSGTKYYLTCDTSSWYLQTSLTPPAQYVIYADSTHYLSKNGTGNNRGATNSTSAESATKWNYDNTGYYVQEGNTKYYLTYYNSNGIRIRSSNTGYAFKLNTGTASGTGTLRATYGSYTYFITLSGNSWASARNVSGQTVTVEAYASPSVTLVTNETKKIAVTSTSTEDAKFDLPHTYFPLMEKTDDDGNVLAEGVPGTKNTGYIVSGGGYKVDPYGDIRVSKFPLVDSQASANNIAGLTYNNNNEATLETVYTVDASNRVDATPVETDLYKGSKESLESTLSGTAQNPNDSIYGLHFMNTTISYGGSNPVIVPKAIINGQTYYEYELPTDCIDFNLKEKGFVNFFAGTYYINSTSGNNDSFFALYKIFRNGNSIQNIMEITQILEHATETEYSVVYLLKDTSTNTTRYYYTRPYVTKTTGKEYVGITQQEKEALGPYADTIANLIATNESGSTNKPSGYSTTFNTSRIKKNTSIKTRCAYYFEIPMNDGEFCLGSVSGANGAYLMYLDIGANATKLFRTTFLEKFISTQTQFYYPLGVGIVVSASETLASLKSLEREAQLDQDVMIVVDPLDSASVLIMTPSSGNAPGVITFDRTEGQNDAKDNVAIQITNTQKARSVFAGDDVLISGLATAVVEDPEHTVNYNVPSGQTKTDTTTRVQYFDYNSVTKTTSKTIISDVHTVQKDAMGTVIDGNAVRTVEYYILDKGATVWTNITDETHWRIYNTDTGISMTIANVKDINCTTENDSVSTANSMSTVIITYSYRAEGIDIVEFIYMDPTINGYYYAPVSATYVGSNSYSTTYTITIITPSDEIDDTVVTSHYFTINFVTPSFKYGTGAPPESSVYAAVNGDMWFDTATNKLYTHNGTSWNSGELVTDSAWKAANPEKVRMLEKWGLFPTNP